MNANKPPWYELGSILVCEGTQQCLEIGKS